MLSKRAASIDSSGIRRVFDLAATLSDPINLSIGQPDFDAPEALKSAAENAIREGKNSYTQTQGIAPLRERIQQERFAAGGFDPETWGTFVCSGVSGALFLAFAALLDPGDEVIIPDPYFCMYRDLALLLNAKPVFLDSYPDFRFSVEAVEALVTPRTKILLLNSPSNPTGCVLSQAELSALQAFAKERGIWLIYDEIYESFVYDEPHARLDGSYDRQIIMTGFSKSHGVCGWRLGYVIAPNIAVADMLKIQQYSFVCAPAPLQWAALAAFDVDMSATADEYRSRRDFVYTELREAGYDVEKPGGAFYIFPRAPHGTASEFVEQCVKRNLLVIPGNVFSRADTHFRISYASARPVLERGLEVLRALAPAKQV